ncbi:hypothetical protein [Bradyrhizobium sp. RDT46]|uniref:hypothetical protein n=1 Tax=Bradyrhizobium sp. RDT46 TaxID=3341829 RepID=UPI0035C697E1
MSEHIFKARVPYLQEFVKKGCRSTTSAWFLEDGYLRVEEIDPAAATVAYMVSARPHQLFPDDSPRHYAVREYGGSLWWPMMHDRGWLTPARLIEWAAAGDPKAMLALDPSNPASAEKWPSGGFDPSSVRKVGLSEMGFRLGHAHANALRMVFCGDQVLVKAGEPIYCAVQSRSAGGVEIVASFSDLERQTVNWCGVPGPDRDKRLECARRGLTFGIDDIEEATRILNDRGDGVVVRTEIETVQVRHRPETATMLCAEALAEFLRAAARKDGYWGLALGQNIPALAAPKPADRGYAGPSHLELLQQLVDCRAPAVVNEFFREVRDARDILARSKRFIDTTLTEADELALSDLAPQADCTPTATERTSGHRTGGSAGRDSEAGHSL